MEKKKNTIIDKFYIILGISVILLGIPSFIITIIHPDGFNAITYWIFYYPAYKLFGGELYLPYYLDMVGTFIILLLFAGIVLIAIIDWRKKTNKPKLQYLWYSLFVVIVGIVSYFMVKSVTEDMSYIAKNTYCEDVVDLYDLQRRESSGRGHRIYYRLDKWHLDVYQYRELKQVQESIVLSIDNFDKYIRRMEKHSDLPPLTNEHKRIILSGREESDIEGLKKELKRLGLELNVKVRVLYLPASKQVLRYEIME